jgi:hypothetical protein
MLLVLAGLAVWVPALLGWGSLVLPGLLGGRLREDDDAGLALRGFAGLGVLGTAGAALNLLTGLGPLPASAAALIGLALFARDVKGATGTVTRGDALAFAGLVLLVAVVASGPIRLHDTGLYHLPAVGWTTAGPIPAGLANLHRRLGLNSLWFPAASLLELPLLGGRGAWLVSSLALVFFGSAVWKGAKSAAVGTGDAAGVVLALGAIPMFFVAITKGLPSLSTDLPVTVLTILSAQFLLRTPTTPVDRRAAVALAALAALVKLSAAVWFAMLLVAVRVVPAALALPAAAWAVRGIALSGYLVYPALWTRIPFLPWAVPLGVARDEIDWARSWGRLPGRHPAEVLSGWGWLGPWARVNAMRLSVLFLMGLLALGVVALVLARRHGVRRSAPVGARAVAAAAIASTLFWFLAAPDIRFGYGALFVLAALPLALALPETSVATWAIRLRSQIAFAAGVALLAFSAFLLRREGEWRPAAFVPPAPPRPVLEEQRTGDGETVRIPVADDRCWDAPRPCTPYFDPALVIERDAAGRPRVFWLPPPAGSGRR